MQVNKYKTTYHIDITLKQLIAIMNRDRALPIQGLELYSLLDDIKGVSNTDYDSFLGAIISLDVMAKHDNKDTWGVIDTMIGDYLNLIGD